jgi:hypothetical protein
VIICAHLVQSFAFPVFLFEIAQLPQKEGYSKREKYPEYFVKEYDPNFGLDVTAWLAYQYLRNNFLRAFGRKLFRKGAYPVYRG